MLKLSVVLFQCKVLAERPLIAQVAQAVETSMSGATDQNPPPICSQLSQRPRNETPLPKNSQRCKALKVGLTQAGQLTGHSGC